ncbi:MAG TPA: ABC transporter permease [Bacillota bacterium]|jgi:peptide/nickel transport system permease protein|nr:ABC transporter permease [Bacillota bacterium]HOJ58119.1 ABC transporter permease [Bacillota bacterium]HOL02460.1 ABC transporter permease [Bacillota bacterium]HPO80964.1 ABC transporter permease [Bacillota bacterium]HPU62117.1 ABC transporter permease [Bacillota bacterium]
MSGEKEHMTEGARSKRQRFVIWHRFKKNKQAVVGLVVLCIFILIAVFADRIAPYWYDDQNPSRALMHPSGEFIFGTDNLGRDVLSRLIYGSRYSLMIGFFAVGISVVFGTILGVIAGYYQKLDNIIMRTMDLFMAIPQILLAICIVTALGSGLFNLMLAVGLSSTPQFARVVRASVLSTKEQEFVEAARAIGANDARIIISHILPNSLAPLIVQATLAMARAIISASALSFLGFGIQPPEPEWGALLAAGRRFIRTHSYLTVVPGLAIMAVVYSLNVVGDGLRDALDPRLKR